MTVIRPNLKSWFGASRPVDERLSDFKGIYLDFHQYVRKTIFFMAGEENLDDLTQEVFVKIWKHRNKFRGQSSLKTWVYRITLNTTLDFLRKHQKTKRVDFPLELVEAVSPELDVKLKERVRMGILQLPEKQRSVFVLYYLEEASVSEIARLLNVKEGTVKSRLSYGRTSMINFLKAKGVDYESY